MFVTIALNVRWFVPALLCPRVCKVLLVLIDDRTKAPTKTWCGPLIFNASPFYSNELKLDILETK
jgi:hypothetical protein